MKLDLLVASKNLRALSASAQLAVLAPQPRPLIYKLLSKPLSPLVSARVRSRDMLYSSDALAFPATTQIGSFLWRVDLPFVARIQDGDTAYEILVPSGWETDYGSVPRVLWNFVPPLGDYSAAYVLHDFLYASETFDRAACDWLLLLALRDLGASWTTRNAVYCSVRAFGGFVWAKHEEAATRRMRRLALATRLQLASASNPYDLRYNTDTNHYELAVR